MNTNLKKSFIFLKKERLQIFLNFRGMNMILIDNPERGYQRMEEGSGGIKSVNQTSTKNINPVIV